VKNPGAVDVKADADVPWPMAIDIRTPPRKFELLVVRAGATYGVAVVVDEV
jgi:hypothetical protein